MTKAQIIDQIAEELNMTKKEVNSFFSVLFDMTAKEIKKEGEFVLPGFGKFEKSKRKARMGRNPATGEAIKIAAKTIVKFKLAKAIKDIVA